MTGALLGDVQPAVSADAGKHDEVRGFVVGPVTVPVVDLLFLSKQAAKVLLRYQAVLMDVPATVNEFPLVAVGRQDADVADAVYEPAALPSARLLAAIGASGLCR